MKIAIIGTGRVGTALAGGWLAAGHTVTFGARDTQSEKTRAALAKLSGVGLAGIAEANTGPIDLEGRLRSFTLSRTVLPPSETWSARVEPDRVRVDVKIVERSTRKEVEGVPVQLVVRPDTPPINLVADARVKLSLKGRSEILSGLEATNLNAYVDCTGLQPGEVREVPIFAPVPSGVELIEVQPALLRVEMRGP